MNLKTKMSDYVQKNVSIQRLLVVIGALLVIYLLMLTQDIWWFLFAKAKAILMPFILGFGIAFILYPITRFLERYRIKRQIAVPLILVVFLLFFVMLGSSILPNLIDDLVTLFNSGVDGIQQLAVYYSDASDTTLDPWILDLIDEATTTLKSLVNAVPSIADIASQFIGGLVNVVTTVVFSLVIGLYLIFDYERITKRALDLATTISPKFRNSIIVVNDAVLRYLKSLIVLMAITFVEYTLLYTLVGHNYALILGVLAAIGLLIPYVGALSVQVLGILTSLTLPLPKTIILAIGLVILSNVDNYIISPQVYAKRDKVDPVASLFVFFASSVLFGFIGLLVSMPIYFSIRAVVGLKKNNWQLDPGSENTKVSDDKNLENHPE